LGVDARLKLTSAFLYHPNDSSHSESIGVLSRVAESSTVAAPSERSRLSMRPGLEDFGFAETLQLAQCAALIL